LNPFELSKLLGVSSSSIEYLEDGKTKNPGISIFRKSIPVLKLNSYDLYELLTGKTYTEQPQGSLHAELESVKKANEEYKEREKIYIEQLRVKDKQISDQAELYKSTMEHAGKSKMYFEEIRNFMAYPPKSELGKTPFITQDDPQRTVSRRAICFRLTGYDLALT
jgi:transcriptional regulator with XRE-family HTH domain